MDSTYKSIPDLLARVANQPESIVSQTLQNDESVKVVLFRFAQGQELSEHTASMPAIMHFLSGQAEVSLGSDKVNATANTWIWMPSGQSHAISAKESTVMLLTLCKGGPSMARSC